jgi:hypothetical protein
MTAPGPSKGDHRKAPPPEHPPAPQMGGVFAATLALESIVVLLALLVLSKFGAGATPLGVSVITALAVAMVVAAGLQRRPWGLGLALGLQLVMITCGLLVPVLAVMGVVFSLVWGVLLLLRRDVARRMARGELPGQWQ